jgi:hypothetical protein
MSGNGCYDDLGDFIVLINNENAVDPSYSELVGFLQQDETDQFPYIYIDSPPGMYYGSAESHVALERIQNIIDGTTQPGDTHVCSDFAERIHNNADWRESDAPTLVWDWLEVKAMPAMPFKRRTEGSSI